MIKCLILIFCFTVGFKTVAQSIYNAELLYELHTSNPNKIIQALVLVKPNTELVIPSASEGTINYFSGNIYAITASLKAIEALANRHNVVRIEYSKKKLQLLDDSSLVRNRVKDIHMGTPPLNQSYDGTDVIVGIIDSGIDVNHPDFKDANGNTRVKFLWDMNSFSATNTPTLFAYGTEWTSAEINAGQCTQTDLIHFGHGTATSGIAAGNGLALNKYEGIAPKADIIVVALNFSRFGFTITDAVYYLVTKAQQLNKPLVINASIGGYYGSHDGTDLETQMITNLVSNVPGVAMVGAAGNAGSIPFHVGYSMTPIDTNFTWLQNNTSQINVSDFADTSAIKNVRYSIGVSNTSFKSLGNIGFKSYNDALNTFKSDTIYHNNNRIGIVETTASINAFGVYELFVIIKKDSTNYLWGIEHTGIGKIDSWNFDYVTTGLPNAMQYPAITKYIKPDTLQTMVSGFQCGDEIITVANYINRNTFIDVNSITQIIAETPGKLHKTSSSGPTRDGRIKPDVAASGANTLAPGSLGMMPNLIANYPQVVAEGGLHVTAGGTSSSAPVVAGLVALYLQKNPTATNKQIKQAIINCAYHDMFTGTTLPNYQWGFGKLDGFKTMTCGELPINVKILETQNSPQIIPHPIETEATLLFHTVEFRVLKLYNAFGQLVFVDQSSINSYNIKKNNLPSGIYILIAESKDTTQKLKLIFR